jgi:regulator of protease activity HflC (stomatin/prohibitin superfamily)
MSALKFLLFLFTTVLAVWWAKPILTKGGTWHLSLGRTVAGMLVIVGLLASYPAVGFVEAGHRGVVLQFGAVTGRILKEGFYVVTPFVEQVAMMSVQTQTYSVPAESASGDLQTVDTKITLNYSLDPTMVGEVYRQLRYDYERIRIVPAVQETVKAATAKFTAEQLITQRPLVKEAIERGLREWLTPHGILVDAISITDFSFSKSFNEAIEAKVTATQRALEAERKLAQVKFEAQQKIATAQAEAQAIQMQGAALKASPEVVALRWIEKWNGQLPTYTMGNSAMPLINLNGGPGR